MTRTARGLSLLIAALLVGCGTDKLETGYAYTPLGDSSAKRRGYYADPFSPEARAAQTEQREKTSDPGLRQRQIPGN